MTKYLMLIGSEAYNYSLIVLFIINVLPKQTKWRQAKRRKVLKLVPEELKAKGLTNKSTKF